MWGRAQALSTSSGQPFYEPLKRVLVAAGFDAFAEGLRAVFYKPGRAESRNLRHV